MKFINILDSLRKREFTYNEKKKLVIDCLIFKKNKSFGYQEYLFNILQSFFNNRASINFDEVIIICKDDEIDSFKQFDQKMSIKGFNIKSKIGQLYIQNNLKRFLRLKRNDVILFTYNYGALIYQAKSVLVVHDLLFLRKKYLPSMAMRMQRKISIPISLKKATKIIAISEFTRSDILHNYKINSEKIFAIYNYFNFNKYTFLEKMDIDIDVRDPYILSVSSLAKHKNIIVILKAFNEICKKTDHILIFVGSLQKMCFNDRNYYEKLEESVKKRIVFFDKISNGSLAFLYKNCSFFVTATLFEGLGMPIIEALYFNAPTVVSDIEVLREITLNKVFYFDPRSSVALVQLLEKYKYNIPRPYMQNDIIEIFSEKNTSQKYIGIINDI